MIRAVLFDLDGVVRHFDPSTTAATEARHGIDDGSILYAAFSRPLVHRVTTGCIRRSEWIEIVGQRIGSATAAKEWGRQVACVDDEMLGLVDGLREQGYVAAVLANGTDTIPEEARTSGLNERFDAIFNSASIGYAKPDPRVFAHVVEALDLGGGEVFFTDDSVFNLTGAARLGMTVHRFEGIAQLRRALLAAGVEAQEN